MADLFGSHEEQPLEHRIVSLGCSPSTHNRVLQGTSGISPEMALRLSKALGRTPESWLAIQNNHYLWQARLTLNLDTDERVDFHAT